MKKRIFLFSLLLVPALFIHAQEIYSYEVISPENISRMEIIQTIPVSVSSGSEISADGEWIMSPYRGGGENSIDIIETDPPFNMRTISVGSENTMIDEHISPNSEYIVARDPEMLWIWDIDSGELVNEFPDNNRGQTYSFSSDGQYLIFATGDDEDAGIAIYDWSTNEIILNLEQPNIVRPLMSPSGDTILSVSEIEAGETSIWLWNLESDYSAASSELIFESDDANQYVYQTGYSNDGQYAVVLIARYDSFTMELIIWDTITQTEFLTEELSYLLSMPADYTDVLMVRSTDDLVSLGFIDVLTGAFYASMDGAAANWGVNSDETLLISPGTESNSIVFWNTQTGEQILELHDVTRTIRFSLHGQFLLVGNTEETYIYAVPSEE